MDLPDHELPSRPLSVKELKLKAEEYEWNDKIPFKYWVRAADHIYREVLSLTLCSCPLNACRRSKLHA